MRSFDIRVRSQDNGSPQFSIERNFTIEIKDINDKPRDLKLSGNQLPENATKGFLIGQLTATDEDVGQVLKFKLTNDDGRRFQINKDGYVVKAKDTNYENQKVHKITVEVSDNGKPVMKVSQEIFLRGIMESSEQAEVDFFLFLLYHFTKHLAIVCFSHLIPFSKIRHSLLVFQGDFAFAKFFQKSLTSLLPRYGIFFGI